MDRKSFDSLAYFAKKNGTTLNESEKKFLTGERHIISFDFSANNSSYSLNFEEVRSHTASYNNKTNKLTIILEEEETISDQKYTIKRAHSIMNFFFPLSGKIICEPKNDLLKKTLNNEPTISLFNKNETNIEIEPNKISLKISNLEVVDINILENILSSLENFHNRLLSLKNTH
ncbi:hypothetical protein GCM10007049_16390 [Echinicola pacifica]|uniref:Uncharacterized protein n=1 Tax=Echinicola pacifica TaxID=346377 RepID=A0A918UPF4_9BACT|nr:hypothetical protein [Echinicola pacifica]GGZ24721.1 hypothetical protein GCM10007049_16390 [Echinicola pacifica]